MEYFKKEKMIKMAEKYLKTPRKKIQNWVSEHILGIFVFTLTLMLLILLYTAGYFHPFFELSINAIFFLSMVLAVFLLGANSRSLFTIGLIFWLLAGFFKVFAIDIWAERTAVYMFQALVIGVILTFVEDVNKK